MGPVQRMQRAEIRRILRATGAQAKLTIGQPNDKYEQEADRVADQVMRMSDADVAQRQPEGDEEEKAVQTKPLADQITPLVQRQEGSPEEEEEPIQTKAINEMVQRQAEEEDEDTVQTKAAPSHTPTVRATTQANIQSLKGGGQALPPNQRTFYESRMGRDFSGVRIHADSEAAHTAQALQAKAFTFGKNIIFNTGQYSLNKQEGHELLAHELTHVIQQNTDIHRADFAKPPQGKSAPSIHELSCGNDVIYRVPNAGGGTQALHQDLIEQYRRAHGLPPHGIDASGLRIGPTDNEIRFGSLLDRWLLSQRAATAVPGVAAPAQAPVIRNRGTTSVVNVCRGASNIGACRTHQNYVQNILPQAIANIRSVQSPYNTAISALFRAALRRAQRAPAPTPRGSSVDVRAGRIRISFAGITHTFNNFTLSLQQWPGGANGRAMSIGGPVAFITMNESSNDAMLGNLANIEETMVHETMHILESIVQARNAARAAGTAIVAPNLERASYASLNTNLQTALTPFVGQIRQLPSFAARRPQTSLQQDVSGTANTFFSEAIARTEAAIFVKQRAGQGFTAANLRTLPAFFGVDSYWSPTPPVPSELTRFLQRQQRAIDTAIKPNILRIQEQYLRLRP